MNKKKRECTLRLGNCQLCCEVLYPKVLIAFKGYTIAPSEDSEKICAGSFEKSQYLSQFPFSKWDAYAEYKCLLVLASDAMMKHDQFIFHCAAVLVNDRVWLLSGPSGVGKSTQYRNLKELYKEEINIISGDNPILSYENKDIITVYPSPWNGKEGWGSMKKGKLAGIVLLEQAKENKLYPVSSKDAVLPVYNEINTYAKTEEQIHLLARLEEKLLNSVPVYRFENTGEKDSSKLLYEQLLRE